VQREWSRYKFLKNLFVLALGALTLCVGCGKQQPTDSSSPQPKQVPKVRLSYMPFASDLAIFVALEKGYFQREGVDVELVKFQSATENLNALLAKRTDMTGMVGISTLLLAFEKAPDQFRAFLGTAETETHWGSALLVPPDSPIRSISDLKGKVVGTYEGTTQLMNLRSIL
jgi:ABC-type nitrate/sulfonate/bicarbonate transport system substrate-binding protein